MRIELEDTPQAGMVSLTQATLRCVLGGIMLLHGVQKLQHQAPFAAQLEHLGVLDVHVLTTCVLSLELLAGAGLVLGRLTRVAAFVATCDLAWSVVLWAMTGDLSTAPTKLELPALMLATSCFFMVVGSGPFGLDYVLRRRARLRAIAKDEIWSRPPYVTHR